VRRRRQLGGSAFRAAATGPAGACELATRRQSLLGADLQWTRNTSKYPETLTLLQAGPTLPAGVATPLADIHNKLTRLKLFATYAIRKNAEVRLDLIHERWETDDWSWLFANGTAFTYGTTTDGTTVTSNPKQTSNFVGIRYVYRFQ